MKKIGIAIGALILAAIVFAFFPTIKDEINWFRASIKNTIAAFDQYVAEDTEGRHIQEAEARIETLLIEQDDLRWTQASQKNTIAAFNLYIAENAEGRHIREAEAKIAALRIDDTVFENAMKTGEKASLEQFLIDFPGHRKQQEANQALTEIIEGRDVVDLLSEKKIQIETSGEGIEYVAIRLRKLVPYPITVRIPVGTYFISSRQSAQNMITTEEIKVRLTGDDWRRVTVSTACANRPKNIPGKDDTFTVERSPHQEELARLMPFLETAGVGYATRQAAVWIVTDNASYKELGTLVSRNDYYSTVSTRVIGYSDTARAMQICDAAGIDITRKRIWRDKTDILNNITDETLKTWLEGKQ